MPTLLRWKGYRFFFYSADGWEPPHIHVVRDGREAKIWLRDIRLAANAGLSDRDLGDVLKVVRDKQAEFLEVWPEHFGR
jgi:hypothetical protein